MRSEGGDQGTHYAGFVGPPLRAGTLSCSLLFPTSRPVPGAGKVFSGGLLTE